MVARALLLLVLVLAGPAAASDLRLTPAVGFAWLDRGARGEASGVALELHLDGRFDSRVGFGATFSWGLTDWDRAKEWIDAGNRAGGWTTDRFADVEAWVRRGEGDDTYGLRLLGAFFADFFLLMTYAAVPVCYVGSIGGATSHLQLDATASVHLADASSPNDAWIELGGGAASLPERTPGPGSRWVGFRRAVGPVVGVAARFGPVRVGARMLVSPPGLNTSSYGGSVVAGALTLAASR